jgi:hypothetical protein
LLNGTSIAKLTKLRRGIWLLVCGDPTRGDESVFRTRLIYAPEVTLAREQHGTPDSWRM